MTKRTEHYDVIVAGAGPAGIGASIAAAKSGARTVLVESDGLMGGMLASGLPILGYCNSRGEQIVGGVMHELIEFCKANDGYVGCICDWRTLWGVCVHPDTLRLGIYSRLSDVGVTLLPQCTLFDAEVHDNRIGRVKVMSKKGAISLEGDLYVDASGDGDLGMLAGRGVRNRR